MAEIVRLSEYRQRSAVQAGYRRWRRAFKQDFSVRTRLNDLHHSILLTLAEPNETSANLFHGLIIGFLGHGDVADFDCLDSRSQMAVVDIHLFLADQTRFEMMRRIGWLSRFGATQYPLFEMVRQFDAIRVLCLQDPPVLSDAHPSYGNYRLLTEREREVFIRRLLPSALERFKLLFPH